MLLQQLLLPIKLLLLLWFSEIQYATAQTSTSGVYLMYKGEVLPNNSAILYDYGSNISIHCITNLRPCCTDSVQGEWYHRERNIPPERISRYDNGTIAMVPLQNLGLHYCILPNATNATQHIYLGIFDADLPFPYPLLIEEMTYNTSSHALSCISRDTPATTVIWRRNGIIINDDEAAYDKIIIDTNGMKYQNRLIGNLDIAGITCQISNSVASTEIYPIIESGVTLSVSTSQADEEVINKFNNNTSLQGYFSSSAASGRVVLRTSYRDCCTINHLHTGECFDSNGTRIVATSSDLGVYYITRHYRKIQLHFQNVTNVGNGTFYCTLPNLQGHSQNFFFSLQPETSIQSDRTPQILYNPVTSTLQCKFKGHAHNVLWHFEVFHFFVRLDVGSVLAAGSQYHQSTIQMTSKEHYYINELTITDRNAFLGPYKCTVCVESKTCNRDSAWLSIALGFTYKTKSYRNNGVILIQPEDLNYTYLGIPFMPVVTCVTDSISCCSSYNESSSWYYPSGRQVSYHTTQGCPLQQQTVNILNTVALSPVFGGSFKTMKNCSGLYQCLIRDHLGELQQLFLGIHYNVISRPTITDFLINQAPDRPSLICISNNSAATTVTWKRNGITTTIDGIVFDSLQTVINTQHSTYENKLIFLISPVPPGLYTCMVRNDFGNATSDYEIPVGEPEPAKIIHDPDNYYYISVYETATISCHGYGNELPTIVWYKCGTQLTSPRDVRITIEQRYVPLNATYHFTKSVLTISNVELEDAGNYSCITRNSNGTDVHQFVLQVLVPAQLAFITNNDTVDLCTKLTLTCEGYGIPEPTINWRHNDALLDNNILSIINTVYHNASSGIAYVSSYITIDSVSYQDNGLYMCNIQNEVGNDTAISTISVNYEAVIVTSLIADQMIVNESDSIRITCEVRGSPPIMITWQRAITPNHVSVIDIHSARIEDGVEYICQAQNSLPISLASKRMKIDVQIVDECSSAPCQNGGECVDEYITFSCNCVGTNHTGDQCQEPKYIDADRVISPVPNISNITISRTTQIQLVSPVSLTCEATGAPPLTYRWYRDGQLIEGKIRPYLYIAEFFPADRGNYSCEVINDEGKDESTDILLTIEGVRRYRMFNIETDSNMQSIDQISTYLLTNDSLDINGEVYEVIVNETTSAAVIVTVYTHESYSSATIQDALAQVLLSEFSLMVEIERYDIKLSWPETEIGHSIALLCPCQNLIGNFITQSGTITRRCGGSYSMGAHWEDIDYKTCGLTDIALELCQLNTVSSILTLKCKGVSEMSLIAVQSRMNDPEQLSQLLVEITNRSEEIQAVGISIATILIEDLTDDAIENEEIRENYLTTIDNLIQADKEEVLKSQAVEGAPMRLLSSLSDFTNRVNLSNKSTILTRETYAILIEDIDRDAFIGETLTIDLGSVEIAFRQGNKIEESALNKEKGINLPVDERFTATVRVPQSIFNNSGGQKQRLSYTVFVQGSLFLNETASQQSIIVGVRVNGTKRVGMLQSPIAPTKNSSGTLTCGRWNTTVHGWSTHDCHFSEIDGKQSSSKMMGSAENGTASEGLEPTVYETKFNQPGYFGLILDLTYGIVDPLPHQFTFTLEVISYICLVLSLVCLTFLIITYLATKQLRNNYHGQILINMSISLACLYLIFLIGARAAPVPALCGISAALLQYFMLVFFGWTVVEAVYLYRNLVQVLVSHITGFVLKAGLTVWILPILVVVLSAGPGYKYYYINDRSFCRSTGLPFWLGVILPFLILNIFNWCVFIMIMVSLIRRSMDFKEKIDLKDKLESVKKQVAIAVGLATLFGLGWGFGLAASSTAIKGVTFTFQLLFSLFVGLQGVILFVLHGVRKREARGQWKEWFTKVSSKSMQLYSIAKSASTATDSRIEMSTLQRSEKKDWGNVPTPDINEIENKSMITESEKSEKEDLGASKKSTASVEESVKEDGAAHRFTKFDNEN